MTLDEFEALWLDALRAEADDIINLLANPRKQERERRTCAAFLRCAGIAFEPNQVTASTTEPPDVLFGRARFEIAIVLPQQRRMKDEWRNTAEHIALVKRLGAGFFGGEGFILEQLTGPGTVFIHAGGDFVEFTLAAGESLQIDTGCIVAFEETVDYDIQLAGGIRTALFGGEGLFLATLTGPGRVIVQSLTLQKMRRELAPYRTGGDEHKGLDIISGIFSSDD